MEKHPYSFSSSFSTTVFNRPSELVFGSMANAFEFESMKWTLTTLLACKHQQRGNVSKNKEVKIKDDSSPF